MQAEAQYLGENKRKQTEVSFVESTQFNKHLFRAKCELQG